MQRRVDGVGASFLLMSRVIQRVILQGEGRARLELAAGASDGRRPLDDAGHRCRLATTDSLNLGVVGHGRARRRTLDAALDFPTHDDGSITEHLIRGREASLHA